MTRPGSRLRSVPSLSAAVLDSLVPTDGSDPVADLRRLLDLTRDPVLDLWEKYRGGRSAAWHRRRSAAGS